MFSKQDLLEEGSSVSSYILEQASYLSVIYRTLFPGHEEGMISAALSCTPLPFILSNPAHRGLLSGLHSHRGSLFMLPLPRFFDCAIALFQTFLDTHC